MNKNQSYINTFSLFFAQAFGMLNTFVFVFIGGLVFSNLKHNSIEATLPFALVVLGTALAAYPAKTFMEKYGRKNCFIVIAIFASLAIALATVSIQQGWFWIFCFASLIIGVARYFMMQYRFAVSDGVSEKKSSQFVSIILLGSILSAVMGTHVVDFTKDLTHTIYVGSFFALFVLSLIVIIALFFYKDIPVAKTDPNSINDAHLEAKTITKNFVPTVILSTCSYFVMCLVMVAAPLQIHEITHFSIKETGSVMQWHFIAMYLPSLFFHRISSWFGNYKVIALGIILFACSAISGLFLEPTYAHYLITLICLGTGWNLCFIGSTVILRESHLEKNKLKSQATNDFYVFAFNVIACLFAGKLVYTLGWFGINLIAIAVVAIMAISLMTILINVRARQAV